MKQHVSVSRLHKLAERLKAKIVELNVEAASALGTSTWRGPVTVSQVSRVTARAVDGVTSLRSAERLSRELARIRSIVAVQNERLGISAKLALQESLNRQLTALKNLLTESGEIRVDALEVGQSTGDYGMAVSALSQEHLQELKAAIARIQREIFGLSDEVAEANATRVELELDEDIAALITG